MSNRIMLNNSNTKFLNIGISCKPELIFPDGSGFKIEAHLGGDKSAPMVVGGITDMRSLFMAIRGDNECQYMHLNSRTDYSNANSALFGINKAAFGGTRCIQVVNQLGQTCFLAMQSVDELLKREPIILAMMTSLEGKADICKEEFTSLVTAAHQNYGEAIQSIQDDQNIIAMDIFLNFYDVLMKGIAIRQSNDQLAAMNVNLQQQQQQPNTVGVQVLRSDVPAVLSIINGDEQSAPNTSNPIPDTPNPIPGPSSSRKRTK